MKTCTVEGCSKKINGRGLCQTHYSRWRLTGRVDINGEFGLIANRIETREELVRHLMRFRHINEVTGCWEWTRGRGAGGYGTIRFLNKNHRVHRVAAWAWLNFSLKNPRIKVCHRCDNPICFNPSHLFIGTQANNVRDRDLKGRHSWEHVRGERNPRAKLTGELVRNIIKERQSGISVLDICFKYDISSATAYRVISGKNWSHIK